MISTRESYWTSHSPVHPVPNLIGAGLRTSAERDEAECRAHVDNGRLHDRRTVQRHLAITGLAAEASGDGRHRSKREC
jgi:hypothetical protein